MSAIKELSGVRETAIYEEPVFMHALFDACTSDGGNQKHALAVISAMMEDFLLSLKCDPAKSKTFRTLRNAVYYEIPATKKNRLVLTGSQFHAVCAYVGKSFFEIDPARDKDDLSEKDQKLLKKKIKNIKQEDWDWDNADIIIFNSGDGVIKYQDGDVTYMYIVADFGDKFIFHKDLKRRANGLGEFLETVHEDMDMFYKNLVRALIPSHILKYVNEEDYKHMVDSHIGPPMDVEPRVQRGGSCTFYSVMGFIEFGLQILEKDPAIKANATVPKLREFVKEWMLTHFIRDLRAEKMPTTPRGRAAFVGTLQLILCNRNEKENPLVPRYKDMKIAELKGVSLGDFLEDWCKNHEMSVFVPNSQEIRNTLGPPQNTSVILYKRVQQRWKVSNALDDEEEVIDYDSANATFPDIYSPEFAVTLKKNMNFLEGGAGILKRLYHYDIVKQMMLIVFQNLGRIISRETPENHAGEDIVKLCAENLDTRSISYPNVDWMRYVALILHAGLMEKKWNHISTAHPLDKDRESLFGELKRIEDYRIFHKKFKALEKSIEGKTGGVPTPPSDISPAEPDYEVLSVSHYSSTQKNLMGSLQAAMLPIVCDDDVPLPQILRLFYVWAIFALPFKIESRDSCAHYDLKKISAHDEILFSNDEKIFIDLMSAVRGADMKGTTAKNQSIMVDDEMCIKYGDNETSFKLAVLDFMPSNLLPLFLSCREDTHTVTDVVKRYPMEIRSAMISLTPRAFAIQAHSQNVYQIPNTGYLSRMGLKNTEWKYYESFNLKPLAFNVDARRVVKDVHEMCRVSREIWKTCESLPVWMQAIVFCMTFYADPMIVETDEIFERKIRILLSMSNEYEEREKEKMEKEKKEEIEKNQRGGARNYEEYLVSGYRHYVQADCFWNSLEIIAALCSMKNNGPNEFADAVSGYALREDVTIDCTGYFVNRGLMRYMMRLKSKGRLNQFMVRAGIVSNHDRNNLSHYFVTAMEGIGRIQNESDMKNVVLLHNTLPESWGSVYEMEISGERHAFMTDVDSMHIPFLGVKEVIVRNNVVEPKVVLGRHFLYTWNSWEIAPTYSDKTNIDNKVPMVVSKAFECKKLSLSETFDKTWNSPDDVKHLWEDAYAFDDVASRLLIAAYKLIPFDPENADVCYTAFPIFWFRKDEVVVTVDFNNMPAIFARRGPTKWVARTIYGGEIRNFQVISVADYPLPEHAMFARWLCGSVSTFLLYDDISHEHFLLNLEPEYASRLHTGESVWLNWKDANTRAFRGKGNTVPKSSVNKLSIWRIHYSSLYVETASNLEDIQRLRTVFEQSSYVAGLEMSAVPQLGPNISSLDNRAIRMWDLIKMDNAIALPKFLIDLGEIGKQFAERIYKNAGPLRLSTDVQKDNISIFVHTYKGCGTTEGLVLRDYRQKLEKYVSDVIEPFLQSQTGLLYASGASADSISGAQFVSASKIGRDWIYARMARNIVTTTIKRLDKIPPSESSEKTYDSIDVLWAIELMNPDIVDFAGQRNSADALTEVFTGYLRTRKQADVISDMTSRAMTHPGTVYEMLMGAGKTSFITPRLVIGWLLQYRKQSLIVLPESLVPQSLKILQNVSMLFPGVTVYGHKMSSAGADPIEFQLPNTTYSSSVDGDGYRDAEDAPVWERKTYSAFDIHVAGNRALQYFFLNSRNMSWSETFDSLKESLVLFDEADTLFDPLSCEFNIPTLEIQFAMDDGKNKAENASRNLQYLIRQIQDRGAGGPAMPSDGVYSKVIADAISQSCRMRYRRDFGFGDNNPDKPANDRTAIPYNGANDPMNGSQFSNLELRAALTYISYVELFDEKDSDGVTPRRARRVDFDALTRIVSSNVPSNFNPQSGDPFKLMSQLLPTMVGCDPELLGIIWRGGTTHYDLELLAEWGLYAQWMNSRDVTPLRQKTLAAVCMLLFRRAILETSVIYDSQKNIGMLEFAHTSVSPTRCMFSGTVSMHLCPKELVSAYGEKNLPVSWISPSHADSDTIDAVLLGVVCDERSHGGNKREPVVTPADYDAMDRLTSRARIVALGEKLLIDYFCSNSSYGALVDVAGALRTQSALTFAREIARRLPGRRVHFVQNGSRKVITSETVDGEGEEYQESEDVPANAIFFYDQKSTVGVDFKQPMRLLGLVTVGSDTTRTAVAQGAFRLRRLTRGHEIDFYATSRAAYQRIQTAQSRLHFFRENEANKLRDGDVASARQWIKSYYRDKAADPENFFEHLSYDFEIAEKSRDYDEFTTMRRVESYNILMGIGYYMSNKNKPNIFAVLKSYRDLLENDKRSTASAVIMQQVELSKIVTTQGITEQETFAYNANASEETHAKFDVESIMSLEISKVLSTEKYIAYNVQDKGPRMMKTHDAMHAIKQNMYDDNVKSVVLIIMRIPNKFFNTTRFYHKFFKYEGDWGDAKEEKEQADLKLEYFDIVMTANDYLAWIYSLMLRPPQELPVYIFMRKLPVIVLHRGILRPATSAEASSGISMLSNVRTRLILRDDSVELTNTEIRVMSKIVKSMKQLKNSEFFISRSGGLSIQSASDSDAYVPKNILHVSREMICK